jgi:hypothetical protein
LPIRRRPGDKQGHKAIQGAACRSYLSELSLLNGRGERSLAHSKVLGIKDLHFHDLRHDGISRLFEIGKDIPQDRSVSGHRSWQNLKRYEHMRQSGDKYAHWKWRKP